MAVVGITACRKIEDYRQAVIHAGGRAGTIEPSAVVECTRRYRRSVHGGTLRVHGGEPAHPAFVVTAETRRDAFEIALVRAARARQIPIFAICRGVQVLNVACGGTLVQDIPTQLHGALTHNLPAPPHESYSFAHEVWLEKDSLLSTLMRERLIDADSMK